MTTATTAAATPAPRPLSPPPTLSHATEAWAEDVTQMRSAGAVLGVLAMPAPDYR